LRRNSDKQLARPFGPAQFLAPEGTRSDFRAIRKGFAQKRFPTAKQNWLGDKNYNLLSFSSFFVNRVTLVTLSPPQKKLKTASDVENRLDRGSGKRRGGLSAL